MPPPRYACTRCGSTNFEEDNGIWYCHNGHEQEGGQQISQDDADFARVGKILRLKETKEKWKIIKVYRGAKGFELYLKAWQHVLWKQCHALTQDHGFSGDLWNIVREIWALRLAKLRHRFEDLTDLNLNEESDPSSVSEEEGEEDHIEALKTFKNSKSAADNPSLQDTISLNYVGIILLRYPTSLSTIYEDIRQERICYMHAIRHVPQEIRDRLAPSYHAALDTITIPSQQDVQLAVYRHATMLGGDMGILLPPLNWRLMLVNKLRALSLPLEIYSTVKRLAVIMEFDFRYPEQHGRRRNATSYPEAQLMALVVVATKLLYPFDSQSTEQVSQPAGESAAMCMDWQAWLQVRDELDKDETTDNLDPARAVETTDVDALKMSNEQLDQYMDWFQQTYTKETKGIKGNQLHKQIVDMFPLKHVPESTRDYDQIDSCAHHKHQRQAAQLKAAQGRLRIRETMLNNGEVISDGSNEYRPGQRYRQYRSVDQMSALAVRFHQESADLACLSIDALLRAVLRTERLLLLHQHEQRRAEIFDGEEVVD